MPASGARRVYGGVTGDERAAERRRRLIEAGMALFGSGSSGPVRVKDVVAEAGLTERYFYESFSDLGVLFEAVLDRTMQTIETEVNAAVLNAPEDGLARVSLALRTAVDKLFSDPRMIRIIFVEALGKGGRVSSHRNEILRRAAENCRRWSGSDESPSGGGSAESRVKGLALWGAASELLICWAEGILEISPAELTDFLVGLYGWMNLP